MTVRLPVAPRALLVAAAIPIIFLHIAFQPVVVVGPVNAYLSDFAVLAVVVAALVCGTRLRFAPLRANRALWIVAALFLVWMAVEVVHGHLHAASYATRTHAVTAAKFAEYALLAPALPLLLRTAEDLVVVLWSFTLWSCAATIVGVAQFFGSTIGGGKGASVAGRRQPSFLSDADFAALSGAVLLLGIIAISLRERRLPRSLAALAIVAGGLGTVLAGAVAAAGGIVAALALAGVRLLARRETTARRAAAVIGVAAVCLAGVVTIRSTDLSAFARFVGSAAKTDQRQQNVQTYSHHTLLAWIGLHIFERNPVLGVGWEGSTEPANFEPVLPAAKRHFPTVAKQAFPSRASDRRYGVQDVWIESLADLGVLGLLLWAGIFVVAGVTAWRYARWPAALALAWLALVAGLWSAQGFVAGIPLDGLTWIAVGLAGTHLEGR